MRTVIVCLALFAGGCASDGAVRCDGKLKPINVPAAEILPAQALAETPQGAEDVVTGKRVP